MLRECQTQALCGNFANGFCSVAVTEATTHGTLPWTADHERRNLIVRYTPGNTAYASPGGDSWPEEFYDGMTDAQRAVLEPPYHTGRADIGRPFLNDDGSFGGGVLAKHGKLHSKPSAHRTSKL